MRINRRQALKLTGGAFMAMLLAGRGLPARAQTKLASDATPLKQRVTGRTFNVHMHLNGRPNGKGFPTPGILPYKPSLEITNEQRAEASHHFTRFKEGPILFDSPEQAEHYARKWVHNERRGYGLSFEESAMHFLAEMEDAGIDTTVVQLLDFAAPLMRSGPIDPSTERIESTLAAAAQLMTAYPDRFIFFAGIDTRRGKSGIPLLEKAVKQYGFRGCGEIVTTLWQTRPDDREILYPYYEKCLELGIPVMLDCTMDRGFTDAVMYEQVAKDFPDLKIALGGAGIRIPKVTIENKSMMGYDRILQLAESYDNLWLDLDDWQVADAASMQRFFDFLRRALDGDARHKIMFGSDFPIYAWMYTEREWIEHIFEKMPASGYSFTDEEMELFFSRNAARYLGI